MGAPPRLPPKKDVALLLLEQASVYVHLDPRDSGVVVPAWFKKQPQLILQIGLNNMTIPIPDLDVGEEGISCTLSFNRIPHFCRIPWGSVFALVGDSGKGMVWPEDVPPEVATQTGPQQAPKREEGPKLRPVQAAAVVLKREAKREGAAAGAGAEARGEKRKRTRAKVRKDVPREAPLAAAPKLAPSKEVASPVDSAPPSVGGAGKRKRELPPYLRVIK